MMNKEFMQKTLGALLIIVGIFAGIYIGLWLCFIGGIAGLYDMVFKGAEATGLKVAIDIVKILFAGFFGYFSAALFILLGSALIDKE